MRFGVVGLALVLLLTACRSTPPTPEATPVGAAAGSWLLEIETPGPHWLAPDWFRARGLDPTLAPEQVRLSQGGQAVPYLLLEGPEGTGLFFYASVAPTRYAPWSVYRLDAGQGAGQLMERASLPEAAPSTAQGVAWTTRWQAQDLHYLPQIEAPEPWFWERLLPQGRITHTVALSGAVAGPLTVTVRLEAEGPLSGATPAPRLWWDGELLGLWRWAGPAEQSWPASTAGATGQGAHTLALELPSDEGGLVAKVWLDGWGVAYRRALSPTGPGVEWQAEADEAVWAGAETARLLDVSDPTAPRDLGEASGGRVRTQPGHRYWQGAPWQSPGPARSRPLTAVDRPALEQAEYLIVAPEAFWPALEPLAERRQSQGRRVSYLTPQQVYDAFGDGRPDPEAIRALVRRLHQAGNLRYLLLVGDGSVRPDGYAGQEGTLRLVTALVPTARLHETPSDQALVADDEGQALVAVGRFPARTVAQVEAMVDKTLRWEESGLDAVLLLVDDQAEFAGLADQLSPWLPIAPQRLETADDDARAETLGKLDAGGVWLNYVGHGSLALWGDEKILRREDKWRQPAVVTVWACLSAYFVHPQQDSLAEVWLAWPTGGAVAFVGPTGETYLSQQRPIAAAFYQGLLAGQPLGDALLAGWQAAGKLEQDAVRSFLLLGDPALRVYDP